MKRIIFENLDKTIGIIIPSQECINIFGVEAIAKKDVPEGLFYWIVEDSAIPTDRTFRGAWEMDSSLGTANGIGSTYSTFKEVLENA